MTLESTKLEEWKTNNDWEEEGEKKVPKRKDGRCG